MRHHAFRLPRLPIRFLLHAGLHVGLISTLAGPAGAQPDFLDAEALREAGLAKYWQLQLPLERDQTLRNLFLVDDQLYVGTNDGLVFGIHAPTGVVRWLREVTRSGYGVRRPAHFEEQVIFATPTDLQFYNRRTGDPIERVDLRFPSGTAPVIDGRRLFVGGMDRRMYAFDLATRYVDWRVLTRAPLTSTPVMHGEALFFASDEGTVYGCIRDNRTLLWEFTANDEIHADLVVSDWGVYVACTDYSLYLLDLEYGRVRWRARFSGPLFEAPVVSEELVYQYSESDGLVAVEGTTDATIDERIRWKLGAGRMALTVFDGTVLVLGRGGTVFAVSTADGQIRSTVSARGFTLGVPSMRDPMVMVASPDGRIFCARKLGTPWLKPEDLSNAYRPATQPGAAAVEPAPAAAGITTTQPGGALAAPPDGVLLGGRSKVTREFQSGGTGGGTNGKAGAAPIAPPTTGPTTRRAR